MQMIKDALLTVFILSIYLGWGVFIWFLARPGLSVMETFVIIAISYAVLAFYCWGMSQPYAGATPVRVITDPKDPDYFVND